MPYFWGVHTISFAFVRAHVMTIGSVTQEMCTMCACNFVDLWYIWIMDHSTLVFSVIYCGYMYGNILHFSTFRNCSFHTQFCASAELCQLDIWEQVVSTCHFCFHFCTVCCSLFSKEND
jgi:hypothetical protein